jgi:HlyD family secretion protein
MKWFVLFLLLVGSVLAADAPVSKPPEDKKPDRSTTVFGGSAAKLPTHKVEKEPFKIEIALKGVFEANELTEIVLRPEAWTTLTVHSAVEHGEPVHKGDTLVTLDLEKIDQAIHEQEAEHKLAHLTLKQVEEELPVLEKSTPVELEAAEHAKKMADEDLKKWLESDRPESEKSAQFMVKMSSHWLEYAKEELRQLEKMYRSNDIREETEEIILKRQRHQVEQAQHQLHNMELTRDRTLKIDLPRKELAMKENAIKQELALEKAKSSLPLTLGQKRLAVAKMKHDYVKSGEKLEKLKKDRDAMIVRAPVDGVVYYGRCVRGQWSASSMMSSKLQHGGSLMPEEVFMTIVQPGPLGVRVAVEEKDLQYVRPETKAKVVPAPYPQVRLAARVTQVLPVPLAPGTFEARLALEGKDAPSLVPGMACTAKLVPYAKADAITVPAAAVFGEELDEDQHYVFVAGKNGKREKRMVTVGKTSGNKTEILQGLQPGDEIYLEKS